jgi:UDP-glucose 4-epimerase
VRRVRRGAVLVTGGAGFVGSFAVRALAARGEEVVVLDDLSKGHRGAVPPGVRLVRCRVQDRARLRRALAARRFDAVLHFAADAYVRESVREPWRYWENNALGSLVLLDEARRAGVRGFVLSSTCAVYGDAPSPILETAPRLPTNPYGRTKAAVEQALEDLAAAGVLASFRLRYFNAAGGAADGSLGEDHGPETHLVPLALRAASGRGTLRILGTDRPTPDGTCVRDLVHVEDLAAAHLAALDRLREGHAGAALNLGTGTGVSVREVLAAAEAAVGRRARTVEAPGHPADPPSLVAAPGRAREVLGWEPRWTDPAGIVASAWAWHRRHPRGYGDRRAGGK